jgi:arylsulfatase
MNRADAFIRSPLLLFVSSLILFSFCSTSYAIQHDAAYYNYQKQQQANWLSQDKQVNAKLQALEKRFGKKPNIIFILTDDVGWGELGWQGGGKHRGTPSPALDKMAYQGMRFWSSYAEPSCTPSRIAIMTGRHPFRTGLNTVLWPGQTEGLSDKEVTIAEVLSKSGYSTAMWGKWHLGELEKHAPENQGFDYAYYGLFNGAPYAWPDSYKMYKDKQPPAGSAMFYDFPGEKAYKEKTGISLTPAMYQAYKGKGRKAVGVLSTAGQAAFEKESIKQITNYIKKQADADKPFFIYWASYAQQVAGDKDYINKKYVDKANAQASFMMAHNTHVQQLLDTLREKKIAENTLVVWWSDNGPMYAFYPISGYTWLQGGKGDILEGGVRVPAMAWWPGMINPGQDPVDMIHLTDLYTTAARIAGATGKIPNDRITDGIDQTSLFLLGEGNSRRNYIFHYSGKTLGAVRFNDIKIHILGGGHGGLPGMKGYNIKRDPGEKFGELYPYLYLVTPVQNLVKEHLLRIKKFPNRKSEAMPEGSSLTPHD